MENSNLIYGVRDKPKRLKEWILYPLQQVFSILVATLLITNITGMPLSSGVCASGIGTIVYLILTKFNSPMYISAAGATTTAVVSALAMGQGNYLPAVIGGLLVALVYIIFAIIIKFMGPSWLNKYLPVTICGPITIAIGLNLSKFATTYAMVDGQYSVIGVIVALFVAFITVAVARFGKGFIKTIPFLIALGIGYILCVILKFFGINLISFEAFKNISLFTIPDFTFFHINFSNFEWSWIPQLIILYAPLTCAMALEHLSDHKSLSAVIGQDLFEKPGIHKTMLSDGISSFVGSLFSSNPNTSYGEAIGCTAASKVGSSYVILIAALIMIISSFCQPIMALFETVPSTVFSGISLVAYGMISFSGLNLLINGNIDYKNTGNTMTIALVLTTALSGISLNFGPFSFSNISLALIVGIIANLIVNIKNKNSLLNN